MAQQTVKLKFTLVRELRSLGRTAWFGDIADVPYEEALDCVRCGVAYPCNEQGGQEAFPEREELTSMEEATTLIDHAAQEEVVEAIDPVHAEPEEEAVGDPRLGEDGATKAKKSRR